jgi:pimeloyl-ACP methyl ester carboxylesterase
VAEPVAFRDPRTFVPRDYPEKTVDLGEVTMNYAGAGSPDAPPLLLEKDFHVFAVDLRGQGRSTWTPGRYTLDNMGNDLVRFIATVMQSCPHETLLAQVKVPVLLTHHFRNVIPGTGNLIGAITDIQAAKVRELVAAAGVMIDYESLPDAAHAMHAADPERFAKIVGGWAKTLS